jgi:hypothetical protein
VAAWKDDFIGTNLEQIQIIKGWVTANGETKEKVYRVAGEHGHPKDPEVGVDRRTCETRPGGFERLCQVWTDPDFNPNEPAFYYARAKSPSADIALSGVGSGSASIRSTSASASRTSTGWRTRTTRDQQANAEQGASCCNNQTTFPFVQPVIQERAWTSPIWYSPQP